MTRQEANYAILEKIRKAVEIHKDWRFHQILQNIGVEVNEYDQFHEESTETLDSMNRMEEMNSNIEKFLTRKSNGM